MKKPTVIAIVVALLSSCGNKNQQDTSEALPPHPGAIVDSASMPVSGDQLNHFFYSVRVIADSNVSRGVYDIEARYGPNLATSTLTMPKGGEHFMPIIHKGATGTFIIGFKVPGDTTFYEYFEVDITSASTKMQYIKAYSF